MRLSFTPAGYSAYLPVSAQAQGAIIFFQDARPDSAHLLDEMKVVLPAVKENIAVVFVATGNPVDFVFSESDLQKLDTLVYQALVANKLANGKLLFAGLSLSGTRAARYAVFCEQNRSTFRIHPSALVLCDAPLDLVRFYHEHEAAYRLYANPLAYATGAMVIPYLNNELGSPEKNLQAYMEYSPFCQMDTVHKNAQALAKLPVRAYHKPDVDWWLQHRLKDYYAMNSLDLAGLVRQLQIFGNKKASLVTIREASKGEGDSPHSWNIVDNEELVKWFVRIIIGVT